MEKIFTEIYKKHKPTNFQELYRITKKTLGEQGVKTNRKLLLDYWNSLEVVQLHKKQKPVHFKITSPAPYAYLYMDILDLSTFKGSNNKYRYALTVLDGYSRFVWAKKMLRKSEIFTQLKAIMKEIPEHKVKRTYSDHEFSNNKQISTYFKKRNIQMVTERVENDTLLSLINRFHRTVRGMLGKIFSRRGKKRWIDKLDEVIEHYNNKHHSGIKGVPSEFLKHTSNTLVQYEQPVVDLRIGDWVRIKKQLGNFAKKSMVEKWSRGVYEILAKDGYGFIVKVGNKLVKKSVNELQRVTSVREILSSKKVAKQKKQMKKEQIERRVERELNKIRDSSGFHPRRSEALRINRLSNRRFDQTNAKVPYGLKPVLRRSSRLAKKKAVANIRDMKATKVSKVKKQVKKEKIQEQLPEQVPEEENIYEVEKIIRRKRKKNKWLYLVKWKGYDDSDNTWEPASNILDKSLIRYRF